MGGWSGGGSGGVGRGGGSSWDGGSGSGGDGNGDGGHGKAWRLNRSENPNERPNCKGAFFAPLFSDFQFRMFVI